MFYQEDKCCGLVDWNSLVQFMSASKSLTKGLGCARFAEILSVLTKTWSSGATECGV